MIPFILTAAAKASIILGVAFVITLFMRRASAAARHVVWLAAFGSVCVLPFAGALLPSFNLPLLSRAATYEESPAALENRLHEDAARAEASAVAAAHTAQAEQLSRELAQLETELARLDAARGADVAIASAHIAETPSPAWHFGDSSVWAPRVFLLWLFGFVMVAVAFAVGVLRTYVLACSAAPAGALLTEEAEVLAAELGIARDVRVVTWDGPAMPMTWGTMKPVVLLPDSSRDWPAERRREVLTHELAHVSRGDYAARLLAALVCAVHWFNPLAWMAAARLRDEQELACDDVVLAGGAEPADYAAHLLAVARSFRVPSLVVGNASVAMARPSQLSDRLLAMMDASRRHAPEAPRSSRMAWAFMALLTFPLAAAMPGPRVAAVMHDDPVVYHIEGAPASADIAPDQQHLSEARSAAAMARQQGDAICPRDRRGRGDSHTGSSASAHDDGRPTTLTLTIREGSCSVEIKMVGGVRINDAETDVADVPRGAWIRVTEDDRGVERRFDMQWRGEQLVRRFRVDGDDVPETAETRAWLARVISGTFERTGYNVVPRTMRAYRAGGLDSALRLQEALSSDYAKRMALTALIDSVRIPAGEVARVARLTRTFSSDYERAELLIAITQKLPIDGAVQEAMVASTSSMSSDYERRRVLTAALEKADLSARATEAMLQVAARMSSDYEKVELLLTFLRGQPFESERRAHLFGAANSISSDYERRRLLSEVVSRTDAPVVIGEVTASAARMSSDYEKAELLVQIMGKFGNNSTARAGVLRATESMSSAHEKNRVLALLARQ